MKIDLLEKMSRFRSLFTLHNVPDGVPRLNGVTQRVLDGCDDIMCQRMRIGDELVGYVEFCLLPLPYLTFMFLLL